MSSDDVETGPRKSDSREILDCEEIRYRSHSAAFRRLYSISFYPRILSFVRRSKNNQSARKELFELKRVAPSSDVRCESCTWDPSPSLGRWEYHFPSCRRNFCSYQFWFYKIRLMMITYRRFGLYPILIVSAQNYDCTRKTISLYNDIVIVKSLPRRSFKRSRMRRIFCLLK